MKKYLKSIFLLCTLVAPLAMSSCAQKTENNQQPETEVKTEEVKAEEADNIAPVENSTESKVN